MTFDTEQFVHGLVAQLHPGMEDWDIVSVGEITTKMPSRELTMAEMVEKGLVDGYAHHVAGDDAYITIGEIHLRRPG